MTVGIKNYEGIKIDSDENRIKARDEFINGNSDYLVADLGDGYFVVKKGTIDVLKSKGVKLTRVEIVKGVPTEIREHIRKECEEKGVIPPL